MNFSTRVIDKRKKKTSLNQYNIYLGALEDDEIFRTGFIPPGCDTNYLAIKWKVLAEKLNNDEKGPSLSAEEWKKRLMDWKHTTRAKKRRIEGGNTQLQMTQLENKAMSLWGSISNTVKASFSSPNLSQEIKTEKSHDGDEDVSIVHDNHSGIKKQIATISVVPQELQLIAKQPQNSLNKSSGSGINVLDEIHLPIPQPMIESSNENKRVIEIVNHELPLLKRMKLPQESTNQQQLTHSNLSETNAPSTSVDMISEDSQNSQENQNETHYANQAAEIEYTINQLPTENVPLPVIDVQLIANQLKRLADIKEQKLRFEIEKFKFKNPGFNYDY